MFKTKNGRLQTLSYVANKSSADHVNITNKSEEKSETVDT